MAMEPGADVKAPLLSNDLEHREDTHAEPHTSSSAAVTSTTSATLNAEEPAATEDQQENAAAAQSCDADAEGPDALDESDNVDGAGTETEDENAKHAAPLTNGVSVTLSAEEHAVEGDQQEDAVTARSHDATTLRANEDEPTSADGAESHAKTRDQNPHVEVAAVAEVEADARHEVVSSRDVSEQLSFGNLFDERSDCKKSTASSDISDLTPSDASPELYPFELEQRARGKTQLSNDILLDIFAWLQRFELDIMHIISRTFRDAADTSVPKFSYRYINVVEYRNGRMEFSVNVFLRGEIAVRNYDSCPDYFSAVLSDRRRWLVAESDTRRAFRRLRYSFVEFFFVQQVPKPSVLDLLRGPEATFLVGTLVLYRAPLKRMSSKAFSRLVFSFNGFSELVVTRSLLNRRLLTDDFLRHCACQGITYVAVDGHSRQCTQLTDNGLLSFVATVVRSCNVTCRLLVGNIKPAASELLLFKFIESAKQGKLVDFFCVALANAPEQQLGEYEPLRQSSKISHFSWRLYAEQVQLEAYRGRRSLYISRNHSKVNCDCLVRVIALNREARKRTSLCAASVVSKHTIV